MDRRAFLRRSIGGTIVVTASVQSGWTLKTLRDLLGRLFRWQEERPGFVTVGDLSRLYKRANRDLYRLYAAHVPEYDWFRSVPLEEIIPGSGRENMIPLVGVVQASGGGYVTVRFPSEG